MSARMWLCIGVCLAWHTGRALGGCLLPQHPTHGRHQPHGRECQGENKHAACKGTPGILAPEEWMLTFRCDPGYEPLDPKSAGVLSLCIDGAWSFPKPPECVIPITEGEQRNCVVPMPPSNTQYRILNTECGSVSLLPGSQVPHDCIMIPYCIPGFRRRDDKGEYITHCKNGIWTPIIPNDFCIEQNATVPGSPETTTKASTSVCALPNPSPIRKFCSLTDGCAENCDFFNERCLVSPNSGVNNIRVVCAQGYTTLNPTNKNVAFCVPGTHQWYPPIPECIKLCRPLKSEMLLLTCRYGTNIVDCSKYALPNTTVSLECAPRFSEYPDLKRDGSYRRIITCTQSGEWSHHLPLCKAACGVFNNAAHKEFFPTIVNGSKAILGFFPWHAGLYFKNDTKGISWDQMCGGSLISERFVLTAAHCVYAVVNDTSRLRIALGKYYRSWDHEELSQKKVNVRAISISPHYRDDATYSFDIALVLLSERIKFGGFIIPVCKDFDSTTNNFQNSELYVTGWGKTDVGAKSSDVLLYNTVTFLPKDECQVQIPSAISLFEKMCAIKNNSVSITQQGDSGGGLTSVYGDGLHYIVGIVSSRIDNISLFTNIKSNQHIDWMENEMKQLLNNNSV